MESVFDHLAARVLTAFRDESQAAFEAALTAALPEIMRRASRAPYLTKRELMSITGWSARQIDYLRQERRIPFVQRGRKILYPTAEIEAYLDAGHVPARAASQPAVERRRGASHRPAFNRGVTP